ncbi:MAG: DUF2299 domain-containing protein [Promethearchaeota archaeon]|nr:MAG: DUF2299 domain-containing protein [Candidatus Lokiarchaeota archaeon]
MPTKEESTIKVLVREYLLDEGILKKRIKNEKLEFGFQFSFPPGPRGQNLAVIKPKDRDLLIITLGTQISKPHVEALNSSPNKKLRFFNALRKFLLVQNLLFRIDVQHYRFEISDQYFLEDSESLSKNAFYQLIRGVFSGAAYANILLGEYCSGKIKPEDFDKSRDFSGSDFSLYT